MKRSCLFIVFGFFVSLLNARVWYVHPDSSMAYIQEGLDSCATGDTVLVAAGTYYENIIWPSTQNIFLISESGASATIIDGAMMERVMAISGVDTLTRIKGFTMQNGYDIEGGAVSLTSGSPIIENCIIINNEATGVDGGGGIACSNMSSPKIRYCFFSDNISNAGGGGLLCYDYSSPYLHHNYFTNNTGDPGAGISIGYGCFPVIDSCTFINNTGDGIYCGGGDAAVNYCNIENNTGYGLRNGDPNFTIDAENNWWGDASGPSGVGSGSGDEVSQWVDYTPWLTQPVTAVKENSIKNIKDKNSGPTIVRDINLLHLNKKKTIYSITGRKLSVADLNQGIYFIRDDEGVLKKIIFLK